ncbi:MAG: HDIG domain-containing metalloprotein [Candidatus Omnitrophota bacterium]
MQTKSKKTNKTITLNIPRVFHYLAIIAIGLFIIAELISGHKLVVKKYKTGQVCQNNIYAPFDFSYRDENNNLFEVKKNEVLVQKGQRLTEAQVGALNALAKYQTGISRINLVLGTCLVTLILFIFLLVYLKIYKSPEILHAKNILLICLLIIYIIYLSKVIIQSPVSIYLIPLASVSMLLTILINSRISFIITIILGIVVGVLGSISFNLSMVLIIGAVVGIYAVDQIRRRTDLSNAGLLIGTTNFIAIVGIGLLEGFALTELAAAGLWGMLNGIGSAVIVAGITPMIESWFRITTNISLLELSDFNQPLLKELNLAAAGTYHHSIVVGNLAENAAEALGANSLLSRVGAYYHDIGKMKMPHYFSENQSEDKHDKLAPTISTLIITNHVKEGIELAQRYKLNKEIIDIIEQHHGTSLVYFFYHRALERTNLEEDIEKESFRYPGPKPQSKEAAIVLLADSVEAASRTLTDPTATRLKELIQRIINNKFIDGQLDECDLSLKDLHKITNVFIRILTGILHTRVEYPEENLKNDQNKDNKQSEDKKGTS